MLAAAIGWQIRALNLGLSSPIAGSQLVHSTVLGTSCPSLLPTHYEAAGFFFSLPKKIYEIPLLGSAHSSSSTPHTFVFVAHICPSAAGLRKCYARCERQKKEVFLCSPHPSGTGSFPASKVLSPSSPANLLVETPSENQQQMLPACFWFLPPYGSWNQRASSLGPSPNAKGAGAQPHSWSLASPVGLRPAPGFHAADRGLRAPSSTQYQAQPCENTGLLVPAGPEHIQCLSSSSCYSFSH